MTIAAQVTELPQTRAEMARLLDRVKGEIAASTSSASFARRTVKTEGELMNAYATVQLIELLLFGEVRTHEPPRHHV